MVTSETLLEYASDLADKAHGALGGGSWSDQIDMLTASALSLTQMAALFSQRERMDAATAAQAPAAIIEAHDGYRELLRGLEAQFRNAGSDTSLRVADRIKQVLDQHDAR